MSVFSNIRSNSGSAFVELVILLPLLIFMVGGVFEIGRMFYIQNSLEYGAKEAARIGSSIKESVNNNFVSSGTLSRRELENLIVSSIKVNGVIEERGQFMIRYLNQSGSEVQPTDNLPFNRGTNPNAVDFVEVEISYPGRGPRVNTPIPAVFNVSNIIPNNVILMSRAIFQIEGRFQ